MKPAHIDVTRKSGDRFWIWFLVLLFALTGLIWFLGQRPSSIDIDDGTRVITARFEPDYALLPGSGGRLIWDARDARRVNINGVPFPRSGEIAHPAFQCQPLDYEPRYETGSRTLYRLYPRVLSVDFLNLALSMPGLALLALLFMYSQGIGGVHFVRLRAFVGADRDKFICLAALFSILLLLGYALLPSCSGKTILDFAAALPVHAAVYQLCLLVSAIVFVVGIIRRALLASVLRAAQSIPVPAAALALGIVSSLLLVLLAVWTQENNFLMALPLLLWAVEMPVALLYVLLQGKKPTEIEAAPTAPANRKYVWLGVLLALWTVLWHLPWQPSLAQFPVISAALAFMMFLVPGMLITQIAYHDSQASIGRAVTIGFALEVAIVASLGLIALVLRQPIDLVSNSIYGMGVILLIVWAKRGGLDRWFEIRPSFQTETWLLFCLGLVVVLSLGSAAYASDLNERDGDYHTYDAYVTAYASGTPMSFQEVITGTGNLEPPRFWLALWPMSVAVIAKASGLHVLVLGSILKGLLVFIALLSVYELAKALGFTKAMAFAAVAAEALAFFCLMNLNEVGQAFITRLDQDKAVTAFILGPVLFRVVLDFYRQSGSKIVFALVCLANTLTHPTMLAVNVMLVGLYCLFQLVTSRQVKQTLFALALLAISVAIYVPFRLLDDSYFFSVTAAQEETPLEGQRAERIQTLDNARFYGVALNLVDGPAFAVAALAAVLAVRRLRYNPAAQYIVAAMGVLALAVIPYTGWLLGLIITPFHLWRVPWMVPFGIATVFAVQVGYTNIHRRREADGIDSQRSFDRLFIPISLLMIVTAFPLFLFSPLSASIRQTINAEDLGTQNTSLTSLSRLAVFLEERFDQNIVVVGYPLEAVNNYIPTLSEHTNVMVFRTIDLMGRQTGLSPQQTSQRFAAYDRIIHQDLPVDYQLELLEKFDVSLILVQEGNNPFSRLISRYPDRIHLMGRVDDYEIYEIVCADCQT